MLDEFVSFNDKKMPDPNMVLKPKQEKIYKPPPLPTKNTEINKQNKSINCISLSFYKLKFIDLKGNLYYI
jgi:hypothetical protein